MDDEGFQLAGSPCVGVCVLDPGTGLCRWCRRTIEEIAAWPALAPAERAAILERLRDRAPRPQRCRRR
jgi:predicted Fe-S protein YdhL (DUF1289 family)